MYIRVCVLGGGLSWDVGERVEQYNSKEHNSNSNFSIIYHEAQIRIIYHFTVRTYVPPCGMDRVRSPGMPRPKQMNK